MSDDKIRAAIKVECDRQHVGEDRQYFLFSAYAHMRHANMNLSLSWVQSIAGIIEPDNGGRFRTTPVSFANGTTAIPADNVPRAMENWIEWFNSMLAWVSKGGYLAEKGVEIVIKEFLDIHPFTDGNGRTAWLLRVWLLNQWDDPQPLPDYYGE